MRVASLMPVFVIAPRQRNTRDENEQIKQGAGDKLWNDNPHKKCHKDVNARWTKKRDETFYGYKQHTKVEKRNEIILSYDTTSAEVHDSKGFEGLLDEKTKAGLVIWTPVMSDKGEIVKQHKMNPIICERATVTVRLPRSRNQTIGKNPRHVALSSMYSGLRNKPCVDLWCVQ